MNSVEVFFDSREEFFKGVVAAEQLGLAWTADLIQQTEGMGMGSFAYRLVVWKVPT